MPEKNPNDPRSEIKNPSQPSKTDPRSQQNETDRAKGTTKPKMR